MNNQSNDSPFGKIILTKPEQKNEQPDTSAPTPELLKKSEKPAVYENISTNPDKPKNMVVNSENSNQGILPDYNKSNTPQVSPVNPQKNLKTELVTNPNSNSVNNIAQRTIQQSNPVNPVQNNQFSQFQRKSSDSNSSSKMLVIIIAVLLFIVGIMGGFLLAIRNKQPEDSAVDTLDILYTTPMQSDIPITSAKVTTPPTEAPDEEINSTEAPAAPLEPVPEPVTEPPKTEPPTKEPEKLYYVRTSWGDSDSQLGAFESFENAKSACISGYSIFDKSGSLLYTNESYPSKNELFQYGIVNTVKDPLNMREEPSMSAKIIYEVPLGAGVEILGEEGDFYYANYTQYGTDGVSATGYLKKEYILESLEIKSLCPVKGKINCHNMGIASFTTTYVALGGSKTTIRKSLGDGWHVTAKNMCESYDVVWYELWDTDDGDYYGWVDSNYIDFY